MGKYKEHADNVGPFIIDLKQELHILAAVQRVHDAIPEQHPGVPVPVHNLNLAELQRGLLLVPNNNNNRTLHLLPDLQKNRPIPSQPALLNHLPPPHPQVQPLLPALLLLRGDPSLIED